MDFFDRMSQPSHEPQDAPTLFSGTSTANIFNDHAIAIDPIIASDPSSSMNEPHPTSSHWDGDLHSIDNFVPDTSISVYVPATNMCSEEQVASRIPLNVWSSFSFL
jgi:hypothetical protein